MSPLAAVSGGDAAFAKLLWTRVIIFAKQFFKNAWNLSVFFSVLLTKFIKVECMDFCASCRQVYHLWWTPNLVLGLDGQHFLAPLLSLPDWRYLRTVQKWLNWSRLLLGQTSVGRHIRWIFRSPWNRALWGRRQPGWTTCVIYSSKFGVLSSRRWQCMCGGGHWLQLVSVITNYQSC